MANQRRDREREQFWRLVLEEHAKSGVSAREFCRRESISEPSFYSWRRKIRDRDGMPTFVEVVPESKNVPATIEIETPAGIKIRFDHNSETIAAVLAAVNLQGVRQC